MTTERRIQCPLCHTNGGYLLRCETEDIWYCPDCKGRVASPEPGSSAQLSHHWTRPKQLEPESKIDYNLSVPGLVCPNCEVLDGLHPIVPPEFVAGSTDPLIAHCPECSTSFRRNLLLPLQVLPEQEMIDGLLVSTDTLAYHLIPVVALERLCERIMLGEKSKGKHAWNGLSANQEVLNSSAALARRFGHGINHAYRLLGKLQRNEPWTEEDEQEASALMWAGMYAICAINQQRKNQSAKFQTSLSEQPAT